MMRFLKSIGVVLVLVIGVGFFLLINFRTEKSQMIDGEREDHYFFNKKIGERRYKEGVLNGVTRTFYQDGKLKSEIPFVNGKRHGTAKHYGMDGNLRYEDEYSEDMKVSRKEYDAVGNVTSEKSFK